MRFDEAGVRRRNNSLAFEGWIPTKVVPFCTELLYACSSLLMLALKFFDLLRDFGVLSACCELPKPRKHVFEPRNLGMDDVDRIRTVSVVISLEMSLCGYALRCGQTILCRDELVLNCGESFGYLVR